MTSHSLGLNLPPSVFQFAANPCRQFAANPCRQFAANPCREQTSPSHPGCGLYPTPLQPCSPPPPTKGVRVAAGLTPLGGQSLQLPPPHRTSPSLGYESGPAGQVDTAVLPANPSLAPRGSAPPLAGRVVGAALLAGSPPPRQQLATQYVPVSVSNSPSWADVVRSGTASSPQPPAATAANS